MCGIVSLVAPLPSREREHIVSEMCELIIHRGPDDSGSHSDPNAPLTLGHRRLAIIDLSPDGRQPMRRGPLWLSFNGEVYNYLELRQELAALGQPFHTGSDTEVLLAALSVWGEEALHRVDGMFAMLLWDEERQRLLLCRDRFGVKPLYYASDPARSVLIAASEPKAVLHAMRRLGLPIAVDSDVLSCFLADVTTEEGERTFFRGISRVLPGELVSADLHDGGLVLRRRPWYQLTPEVCEAGGPADDEQFLDLLKDAIRLRLRSDVPVGTCLSGGLDSSSLVCLAAKALGVRPVTFSAVYGPGDAADESRFIAEVTAEARVDNARVRPEEVFTPDGLLSFVALHDEPIGGTSVWAQHCVFRLARQHGVTVMLDGQGADETLTGYHGAFRPLWAELMRRRALYRLAQELRAAQRLHGYAPLSSLAGGAILLLRKGLVPEGAYQRYLESRWRRSFTPERTPYFRLHSPPLPQDPPHLSAWERKSFLHGYLYQLIMGSSLQTILRYEDRNSMAASIEARAPFLDYRLVQHCLARPAADLLRDGYTKSLLRRTLRGILPDAVRLRPDKIGFATPEGRWLRGPLRPVLSDLLASPSMAQHGWFRVPALQDAYTRFCQQADDAASADSHAFWKCLNVELWLRQHGLAG